MHVRAPYPQTFPYEVKDETGRKLEHVIEADDETGEYVIVYTKSGKVLTDRMGHVLVSHKRAGRLVITPLTDHSHHIDSDDVPLISFFQTMVPSITDLAGEFETVTLTRDQLITRLFDVLEIVLSTCAGHSPAGPGFVWLPIAERDGDGNIMVVPPKNWEFKDVVDVWEKYNRLQARFPEYLETDQPPIGFHPENG